MQLMKEFCNDQSKVGLAHFLILVKLSGLNLQKTTTSDSVPKPQWYQSDIAIGRSSKL